MPYYYPFLRNDFSTDVNGGQKILIRLRPAGAPDTFYDEEYLLGTMLHEVDLVKFETSIFDDRTVNSQRPWPA